MSLLSLHLGNLKELAAYRIDQIVAMAGDGRLRDGSECSAEFRSFLGLIPLKWLRRYTMETLSSSLQDGGLILQDLVNELGRRLGYEVQNGRYRGVQGQPGHDGLWESELTRLVLEVKTTDTYRINLNTIANYVFELKKTFSVEKRLGVLIVVGRQDTGDLEAQIRGSKHAWDFRIISAESLEELAELKEVAVDTETENALRHALLPIEYTRVDEIVMLLSRVVFDVERGIQADSLQAEDQLNNPSVERDLSSTEPTLEALPLDQVRDRIISVTEKRNCEKLRRLSKTRYESETGVFFIISVSKRYSRQEQCYWYAFQSSWLEPLSSRDSFLCLGMTDKPYYVQIPGPVACEYWKFLNRTDKGKTSYSHIALVEQHEALYLNLPKAAKLQDLTNFVLEL